MIPHHHIGSSMSNYFLTMLLSLKRLALEIKAGEMNDLPINCYALCVNEGCCGETSVIHNVLCNVNHNDLM